MIATNKNIDEKAISWKRIDLILSVMLIFIVGLILFYFN
jgi:hypothetical protein